MMKLIFRLPKEKKGGAGSGHHGHAGRPGKREGSLPGTGGSVGSMDTVDVSTINTDESYSGIIHVLDKYQTDDFDELFENIAKDANVSVQDVKDVSKLYNYPEYVDKWEEYYKLHQAAALEFDVPAVYGAGIGYEAQGYKLPIKDVQTARSELVTQRAILRSAYVNTQNMLVDAGYKVTDTITLYRGIHIPTGKLTVGTTKDYRGMTLDSWTFEIGIARSFGNSVIAARIPVKNILDVGINVFGDISEGEVVVLGSLDGVVTVIE